MFCELKFVVIYSQEDLQNGEDVAQCPSCSLLLKVIYDVDDFLLQQTSGSKCRTELEVAR